MHRLMVEVKKCTFVLSRDVGHGEKGDSRLVKYRARELKRAGVHVKVICVVLGNSWIYSSTECLENDEYELVRVEISWASALLGLVRCLVRPDRPIQAALSYSGYARRQIKEIVMRERKGVIHFMTARVSGLWELDYQRNVTKVMDLVDSYSAHYSSYIEAFSHGGGLRRRLRVLVGRVEADRYRKLEDKIFRMKDANIVLVSRRDREFIEARNYSKVYAHIKCIPIGMDLSERTSRKRGSYYLFYGNLSYWPNRNAAIRLIDCIWPKIYSMDRKAELVIGGRSADEQIRIKAKNTEGVRLVSPVVDMDELIENAIAVISPVNSGSGMQFKVIEPMGMKIPVICDEFSAIPLELEDRNQVLVCKSDEEYVQAAETLKNEDGLVDRLTWNALEKAKEFSWARTTAELIELYRTAMRRSQDVR